MRQYRRCLHQNAEAGEDLPATAGYVMDCLRKIGLEPVEICPSGVVAVIRGEHPGKTLLLRADMDALPMPEVNDLPFRTVTGAAHTCGHDIHTAMLLGAAQILQERRSELHGCVKLMFQPAEEVFTGSRKMIDAGVLEGPKVDAAMAMHVMVDAPAPALSYCPGYMTSSCDGFKITVTGCGCHGAMPHMGVDPINAGVHIYTAFQNLVAREAPPGEQCSLTFGAFSAGSTANIIPNSAVLMGTLRTYSKELRTKLAARMREICEATEKLCNVKIDYEILSSLPSTYSDPALTEELAGYAAEIAPDYVHAATSRVTASDDLAFIAERVPTAYFQIGCRVEGCAVQHHNPGVLFDEAVLPYGAATHAACALNWLRGEN